MATAPAIPVVIDTDIGTDADDALALAYAMGCPELDVLAVTVCGERVDVRAQLAARVLRACGREDIPVHAGASEPFGPDGRLYWFGHEGQGVLGVGPDATVSPVHAVDALADLLAARADVQVITIGTLTNVAMLLERHPADAARIARLVVMGGHLGRVRAAGGELPMGFDYNLVADPHASATVLTAGLPLCLVPVDATFRLPLREADVDGWRQRPEPLLELLVASLDGWAPLQRALLESWSAGDGEQTVDSLHDPLTVVAVARPDLVHLTTGDIGVSVEERLLRTRLDASRGTRCAASWVEDLDEDVVRAHILERIERAAARTA